MDESELDRVIEVVLVDAYGEEEETVAWETVLQDVINVPVQAQLLGQTVTVTQVGTESGRAEVTARCQGPDRTDGEVAFADLLFPRQGEAAWLHAAYRRYLGLQPFPAEPRPDWTWPDC